MLLRNKTLKGFVGVLVIVFSLAGFNYPAMAEGPNDDDLAIPADAMAPEEAAETEGPSRLTGVLSSGDQKQVRAKVESLRRLALALKALREKRAMELGQEVPLETEPGLPERPEPNAKIEAAKTKEEKVEKKAWWER